MTLVSTNILPPFGTISKIVCPGLITAPIVLNKIWFTVPLAGAVIVARANWSFTVLIDSFATANCATLSASS